MLKQCLTGRWQTVYCCRHPRLFSRVWVLLIGLLVASFCLHTQGFSPQPTPHLKTGGHDGHHHTSVHRQRKNHDMPSVTSQTRLDRPASAPTNASPWATNDMSERAIISHHLGSPWAAPVASSYTKLRKNMKKVSPAFILDEDVDLSQSTTDETTVSPNSSVELPGTTETVVPALQTQKAKLGIIICVSVFITATLACVIFLVIYCYRKRKLAVLNSDENCNFPPCDSPPLEDLAGVQKSLSCFQSTPCVGEGYQPPNDDCFISTHHSSPQRESHTPNTMLRASSSEEVGSNHPNANVGNSFFTPSVLRYSKQAWHSIIACHKFDRETVVNNDRFARSNRSNHRCGSDDEESPHSDSPDSSVAPRQMVQPPRIRRSTSNVQDVITVKRTGQHASREGDTELPSGLLTDVERSDANLTIRALTSIRYHQERGMSEDEGVRLHRIRSKLLADKDYGEFVMSSDSDSSDTPAHAFYATGAQPAVLPAGAR